MPSFTVTPGTIIREWTRWNVLGEPAYVTWLYRVKKCPANATLENWRSVHTFTTGGTLFSRYVGRQHNGRAYEDAADPETRTAFIKGPDHPTFGSNFELPVVLCVRVGLYANASDAQPARSIFLPHPQVATVNELTLARREVPARVFPSYTPTDCVGTRSVGFGTWEIEHVAWKKSTGIVTPLTTFRVFRYWSTQVRRRAFFRQIHVPP